MSMSLKAHQVIGGKGVTREDFKFDTFAECQTLLENFRPQLQDSLQRKFSGGDRYSVRCVDSETLYKLQEAMGYEEERNT